MNYVDHCTEQNIPVPKEPVIFSKFNSAITEPNGPVLLSDETQVYTIIIFCYWTHQSYSVIVVLCSLVLRPLFVACRKMSCVWHWRCGRDKVMLLWFQWLLLYASTLQCLDFEVELAFVMAKEGKNIPVSDKHSLAACYKLILCFSYRLQRQCPTWLATL